MVGKNIKRSGKMALSKKPVTGEYFKSHKQAGW